MAGTTPRPAAICACLAMVISSLAAPAAAAGRAGPEGLPDLSVSPEDILFLDEGGAPVSDSTPGRQLLINVTVHNAGQAGSGPFQVSFFENGALLEKVRAGVALGAGNSTNVGLDWDTSLSFVGLCAISVELECPAGDADRSNDAAARTIRFYPVAPEISLRPEPAFVDFEPAAAGNTRLSIRGGLEVRMPFNQTARVFLLAETDLGWACAAQPAFLVFDWPGSGAFSVSVVVPGDAEGARHCNLTVRATAISGGYTVPASAVCRLTPKPVFGLSVACDRPYMEITPGAVARFTLKVTNTGNFRADMVLNISNLGDLEAKGWAVSLSRRNLTAVAPGETRTVNITARSPDEQTIWKSEPSVIIVNATAAGFNGSANPYRYPVYAYEKGATALASVAMAASGAGYLAMVVWLGIRSHKRLAGKGRPPGGPSRFA